MKYPFYTIVINDAKPVQRTEILFYKMLRFFYPNFL